MNERSGGAILVAGGRGFIGSAIVKALAAEGRQVIAADIRPPENGTPRAAVHDVVADLCDRPAVAVLATEVERLVGSVDILVNCMAARPPGMFAGLEDVTSDVFEEVLRVHVLSTFLTCQRFGSDMAQRGRGAIVNFGSIYGVVGPDQRIYGDSGFHGVAAYSAAKGAVIGLSKYLAALWGKDGVRVNVVSPGGVQRDEPDAFVKAYSARVPMGRMGRIDEVVSTVQYLVSDRATYTTGQNIIVDGGLTSW